VIDRHRVRVAARWLLIAAVASLVACASPSSTDQLPSGPKPAVTVLLRVRSPDGPQVQLLATGVPQEALDAATTAVARSVFPDGRAGASQPTGTEMPATISSTASITFPDEAQTFTVTREQIDGALASISPAPKSVSVWACSDDRRSVLVTTDAPGAVSSDVSSGSCKIVGTSLVDDGIRWSSTVQVGELQPPSLLPVAIVTSVVLVLIALGIAYLRGRAAARDAAPVIVEDGSDPDAAPSEPSVD
jgi:hypothetical protein